MGPPPLRDTSFYLVCLLPKGHLQLDLQQCLLAQIPPISPFSPLTSLNVSPPLHCLILRVLSPLHVSPFVSLPQGLPLFPIFAKTPCAPVPGWSYGMQCVGLICFRAGWKCLWLALAQREGYTVEGQLPGSLWEFAWVSPLSSRGAAGALQPLFRNYEDFTSRNVVPIAKMLRSKTTPQEPWT